jgi:beta-lactam-binding protein with PASTA domain
MSTEAAATVRCPRCGTLQPATLDFCTGEYEGAQCAEYLGWSRPPAPAGDAGTPSPQVAPPDAAVQMIVEFTGVDRLSDGTLAARVTPGDRVSLDVTLRNIGTIVDEFTVAVHGLPAGWVEPASATANLVPIGHEGRRERKLTFVVRPPRDSSATAGTWPITVVARSQTRGQTLANEPASLIVEPFFAVVATARPQIVTGRRKARIWCDVRNNGNAAIAPTLLPSDSLGTCTFSTPSGLEAVRPGHTISLPLDVRAPRHLIGQRIDHQVQIVVVVDGLDPPTPPLLVIFRQRPLIPWWVPIVLALLAAVAVTLYLAWPRKVTMPSVVGSSTVFVAQRMLQRAGLKGAPKVLTRVLSRKKAGTVMDQDPAPFARVDPDVPLMLRVAVPATYTVIPDLTGMTVGEAEDDLHRRYLKLGPVVPTGQPPSRKIAGQVPLPGRARSRDITSVAVVLAGPGTVTVPNVVCKTMGQAEKLLTLKGLKLATPQTAVTSTQKALGQVPVAGSKRPLGAQVSLMFKGKASRCQPKKGSTAGKGPATTATGSTAGPAGSPPLALTGAGAGAAGTDAVAFDDGRSVRMSNRRDPLQSGQQPAWSPDGALLAVRSDARIRITSRGAPPADRATVGVDQHVASAPAFAPVRDADPVLAFVATPPQGSSEVCFARVTSGAISPSCLPLPDLRARSLAWSGGGGTILVVGVRRDAPERPGVMRLRLRSEGAERASASSWRADPRLWRPRAGDETGLVYDIAYDPRSTRLAVVTNLGPGGAFTVPQVALVRSERWPDLRSARWLEKTACQLAWSPAGTRLAVVTADPLLGCPLAGGSGGRLVTFAVDAPEQQRDLAAGAHNPAWRP